MNGLGLLETVAEYKWVGDSVDWWGQWVNKMSWGQKRNKMGSDTDE